MADKPSYELQPGPDRIGAGPFGPVQYLIVDHRLMDRVGRLVVVGWLVTRQIVTVERLNR